jgi:hypothetical protein
MPAPIVVIGAGIGRLSAAIHVDGGLSSTCANCWAAVPSTPNPALARPRRPLTSWRTWN